jgi:glycosyltransferase involved in cell wall biosynthesis
MNSAAASSFCCTCGDNRKGELMTTRILFLCAAHNHSIEYVGRRRLAELLDPAVFDSSFIWQDHTHDRSLNQPARLARRNRNFFYDFGRNMALTPKPSKQRRALMMAARLPGAMRFLAARMAEIRPHVIYTAQQSYDVVVGRLLSAAYRTPHFIHIHYPVGPWLGRVSYEIIRRTEVLFTVSDFIRQTAINAGVPSDRIRTLLNPANVAQFDIPRDPVPVRSEFGLPSDARVVLSVGRLDPSKGHPMLFDAFAQVQRQMPNTYLIICGETTTRDGYDQVLRQRVAALGLEKQIIFAGSRTDLPKLYAGTDVFCLPTRNEAFGNVFVEAMLAQVPTVGLRSGATPEIVEDGKTGLLCDNGDVAGLAANLLALLRDPKERQRMGAAGRARALALFSPDTIAATWASLLQEAIRSTGAAGSHAMPSLAGRE